MDLVELYIYVDDFFMEIEKLEIWDELLTLWQGRRRPNMMLSISEILTLNILRFSLRITELKSFHGLVVDRYAQEFPSTPNYVNFLKATNQSSPFIQIFLKYLLYIN